MSFSNIYRATNKLIARIAICVMVACIGLVTAHAQDGDRTLLIINSYNESSPWSKAITQPISNYLSSDSTIRIELVHINNTTIRDSAMYYKSTEKIMSRFEDRAPDYVVMLGNMAFNMRDRIKEAWGKDVPVLLVARQMEFGPLNYYFSDYDSDVAEESLAPLTTLRDKYNFTVVLMPDCYIETIDLMMQLMPQMEQLEFISDDIYLNRALAAKISDYVSQKYPSVHFNWLHASFDSARYLQNYLVHRQPKTGLLMSTWFYEMVDANNYPVLVTGELNLISSSINPIFSLRQSYMSLGTVGGVYPDYEEVKASILHVIQAMMQGRSMRELPFYEPQKIYPVLNYPLMQEYDLPLDKCPKNTEFVEKPQTWLQHYSIPILIIIILALLSAFIIWRKSEMHTKAKAYSDRLNKFINNMPVPYTQAQVRFNRGGKVIGISYTLKNQEFERLIQENEDPSHAYLLFPAEFISEKVTQLFSSHKPVSYEYHFDKTDSYYDFLLCVVDRGNQEQDVQEIDVFATDITESRKLSSEIESTSDKLSQVLRAAKLIPWQWTLKTGEVVFDSFNIDSEFKVQVETYEQKGQIHAKFEDCMAVVHPDDRQMVEEVHHKISQGLIQEFQVQYRSRFVDRVDEDYQWVEVTALITKQDADGKPLVVTGSLAIITERRRQEEEMKETIERANESDYLKSAFLANMSHEIRTPLNAIVGFSSLMAKADSKEKREEFASLIEKNNDLLLTIVNDVLDLAKIEANTIDVSYAPVDINQVIEKAVDTIKIRIPKGVVLNLALGAQQCWVSTDENRLSQVLINLLSNACKFTTKGSITLGYDVHEGDELYFYIKDTGMGIKAEDQERVFERFVKVNNFVQGTGLGLPICRSIVQKMGGEMGVNSRGEGMGSTFWFTLPYVPVEPQVDSVVAQAAEAAERDGSLLPKHLGLPQTETLGTILVAEDNHSNYRLIEHLIGKSYNLVRAENGAEAVEMCLEQRPDIIIMDISMPVMDGYEATAQIRKFDQQVPIIAVTAYAMNSDRDRIMQSGFNGFVSKPINQKELIETLMTVSQGGGYVKIR